jgi:hypothetical protein
LHREHPVERWAGMRRTHDAVLRQILKLARASRQKWPHAAFSPEEDDVLDQYAQGMMKQRSPSVKRTAQACWEELERRHLRKQQGAPPELRAPQPRSLLAVRFQVRRRSLALGRAKRQTTWTSTEMDIALKWWRKLLRTSEQHGRLSRSDAGRIMATELKRRGFDRTQTACLAKVRELCTGIRRRIGTPRT